MGASEWLYFLPYQPDINKALHEIQEHDFTNHGYYDLVALMVGEFQKIEFEDYHNPYDYQPRYNFSKADYERWITRPQPETIDDLVKIQGGAGTHCSIDVDSVSPTPEYRMASPLAIEQLLELFGTERPTREMIQEQQAHFHKYISEWMAVYTIAYTNGVPTEIFFYGVTGD